MGFKGSSLTFKNLVHCHYLFTLISFQTCLTFIFCWREIKFLKCFFVHWIKVSHFGPHSLPLYGQYILKNIYYFMSHREKKVKQVCNNMRMIWIYVIFFMYVHQLCHVMNILMHCIIVITVIIHYNTLFIVTFRKYYVLRHQFQYMQIL